MELTFKNRHSSVLKIPLTKGGMIAIWGILVILFSQLSYSFFIKTFGVLNLLASMLTFWFIIKHAYLKISKQWLILEACIELVAGVFFTFWISTVQDFIYYISLGIFFIIILQFIYGYALLNSGEYNYINLIMRFITLLSGIIIGVLLFTPMVSYHAAFVIIGVFSIIYGIVNIQYGLQMRNAIFGKMK